MESFFVSLAALIEKKNFNILCQEKRFMKQSSKVSFLAHFFGIAYFAVDGLLKLADDQQELLGEMLSQCEELEEKLPQCKEAVN